MAKWSPRKTQEFLDYLEREAASAEARHDAPSRLAYLSREAWHVAMDDIMTATPALTSARWSRTGQW